MKTKPFFLIACIILLVTTGLKTSKAQVPDLNGYEFYSAYGDIIISMTSVTKSYKSGDAHYWPNSRAIFQTVTQYDPIYEGSKYFSMEGNMFVGKSTSINNHNGPEQQYLNVIVNNDFSYVQYFSSLKYGVFYETQGSENYYRACSSSLGTKIPYYDKLYYSYNNENFLRLRYVLSGPACASKIGNIEWQESYIENGDTSTTEQIVEYYSGDNDRIEIQILLKKYEFNNTGGGGDFNGGGAVGSWGEKPTDKYTGFIRGGGGLGVNQEYTIINVDGDVELFREGQDEPILIQGGEKVVLSDRLYTGMESRVRVMSSDGSILTIGELSDIKLAGYTNEPENIRRRLDLVVGEVNANINHEASIRSDFGIKEPTATCGVRGTAFTVKTDSVTKISKVYTTNGTVVVSNEGFDSTQVAGIDFLLDSVDVNAWQKVTVNNHIIGEIQPFSISKVEISPQAISVFPYQSYVFSPEGIANDGTKVPLKTNWICTGGEVYENGIFVSNGEKGVYTIECYEPDNQLTACATIIVDEILPNNTKTLYVGSPIASAPGDTIWTNIILGTKNNTVERFDSIAFDLTFTNPQYLQLFTSEASSFVVSYWANEVFDVQTQSSLTEGKINFNLTQKNETQNLNGSGELLKVGFLTNAGTPALTEIDFNITNITARDSSGFIYNVISNTSKTTISERAETPIIETDKTVFAASSTADISTTDGSIIYYTTNGKTPTENDEMYVSTLTIDSTTVLKARVFKTGMLPGFVAEQGFLKVATPPVSNKTEELGDGLDFKCYPNPVKDFAIIEYNLQKDSEVYIEAFNLAGEKLETILHQNQNKGQHTVKWSANKLHSAICLLRIKTEDYTKTIKVIK